MHRMIFMLLALLVVDVHAAPPQLLGPPVTKADIVDYSCRTDQDCSIKNVGNCCGEFPSCVNRDSPTFPERVKAECERNGTAGVCDFPVVESCACINSRCSNVTAGESETR